MSPTLGGQTQCSHSQVPCRACPCKAHRRWQDTRDGGRVLQVAPSFTLPCHQSEKGAMTAPVPQTPPLTNTPGGLSWLVVDWVMDKSVGAIHFVPSHLLLQAEFHSNELRGAPHLTLPRAEYGEELRATYIYSPSKLALLFCKWNPQAATLHVCKVPSLRP